MKTLRPPRKTGLLAALLLLTQLTLLTLLCTRPAPVWAFCDGWSRQDTVLQGAVVALQLTDWAQTRKFTARHIPETNSLLGTRPDPAQINRMAAAAVAGHLLVSCYLDAPLRTHWQVLWIGIEADAVRHNYALGMGFGW